MSNDPKDDVDRLFACFKCGISPPQSAMRDRKKRRKESKRASLAEEGASATPGTATPGLSRQQEQNSAGADELGASTSVAIKFRSDKQISPVIFYGSPHGAPVKRPSQLLRLLREIRVDLREQNDLIPSKDVWATFPRQEEAMRFAKTHALANVFSYQDHWSGQRRFLVSTYDEFWRRYKSMDSKLRHHYEVIQEGLPCHLYFDLEFNKKFNADRDVDEMVDILISMTFNALADKYSIKGNHEWIVELDSSTNEKFSRHLIIRIPQKAFKDNSHAGAFVAEVCSRIVNLRGSDPRIDKLYIVKDSSCLDSPRVLFLDTAVYSRNRCFRLALSSKAGKNSFLLPTGRFKCNNMEEEDNLLHENDAQKAIQILHCENIDQQLFLESLISRMDADCDKLLICKMDIDCKKILYFDSEAHEQNSNIMQTVAKNACRSDFSSTYFSGRSPFPALDGFVESIASSGNISGRIRCWYWFSAYSLMVYSMSRNRYCERIGREHKSNHVMYIVDFQRSGYYQKCYDPDCKGYRSPLRQLPWDVIPDDMAIFNSAQAENYGETVNINLDLQIDENNMEHYLCGNDEGISDSCKKESSWWREAMRYADCIETMRNGPDFSKLDVDMDMDVDVDEDPGWWTDAEKIVSQVEERVG